MAPPDDPAGPRSGAARLICRCMGISSSRIAAAVAAGTRAEVAQVERSTGAGTGCGACHPELRELCADLAGQPVTEADRQRNRRVCRSETRSRVERALLGVSLRLAKGVRVQLLDVDGLRVELGLSEDDPDLRSSLEQRLKRVVCADIHVRFRSLARTPGVRRFR